MFPWVYEFHWTPFHVTFLIVFFTVFAMIIATCIKAILATRSDFESHRAEKVRWHVNFQDLPPVSRVCRHELTGEILHRSCDNEFDCRTCRVHPEFVSRRQSQPQPAPVGFDVLGFSMPPYRKYHRGHTWVQKENDGTYLVGLDDFAERLIGKQWSTTLPPIGTALHVNETGWVVKNSHSTFRIIAPIDGEIVEHGDKEKGYVLKIRPASGNEEMPHLLHGSEIRPWIMREMERLQYNFASKGVGVALADGGELVPGFQKEYPNADWDGIVGGMLLEA